MTRTKRQALLFFFLQANLCLVYNHILEHNPEPDLFVKSKQVIESFHVQTDIRYRFATTKMCSVIRNTAGIASEMSFDVTLPKEAFIVSFAMTIDGKVYDGEVKEKNEAKKQYHQAVERGQSAGHIRQTPRHSNRFDVSVNIANGTAVNFTLVYQQILSRKLGFYEYEMHVEPGQAVEDFNVEVFIQESRKLMFVKTPKLRKASVLTNEIEAPNELTIVDRPSPTTAHIQYKPTVSQQGSGGLAARFVVQYDVDHSDKGEILVSDGYFLHLFSPKPSKALPKDIIFVLDVSGSMRGTKIAQLKEAMMTILEDLTEEDRFNILTFSGDVHNWRRVLGEVNPAVISEAKSFVQSMTANGGTNINMALLKALDELKGREVQRRAGMIFFLTDGEPTSGETNSAKIARNVQGNNRGMSIYSLAFGDAANFESLKTISTQNSGFARKIYAASDAALQVASLYEEISVVAMKEVKVTYLPGITKTTQTVFPVVNNGTEIMITGCIDLRTLDERLFMAQIEGIEEGGNVDIVMEIDDVEEVTISSDDSLNTFFTMPRDYSGIVEKMWAFLTIKQMLIEKQGIIEEKDKVDSLNKKILEMSLKYKFVTPLTSMVVTKPDTDKAVQSSLEDVDNLRSEQAFMSPHRRRSKMASNSRPFAQYNGPKSFDIQIVPRTKYNSHPRILSAKGASSGKRGSHRRVGLTGKGASSGKRGSHRRVGLTGKRASSGTQGGSQVSTRRTKPKSTKGGSQVSTRRTKPKSTKAKKRKGRKSGKKANVGILRSIVFKSNQSSICLAPKQMTSGKYVLAEVANDVKVELSTGCIKNCRLIIPGMLFLTSGGKTTTVNLTSIRTWEYEQHQDFEVTFVLMHKMVLDHEDVMISITRTKKFKKILYSLELFVKSQKTFSGMIGMLRLKSSRKRKLRRTPKACGNMNTDISLVLSKRKSKRYLA